MKKECLVFLALYLLFLSCNRVGIKDNPIPAEQIFGTYDLWNGESITFDSNYTYLYLHVDQGVVKRDTGVWNYHYYPGSKTNQIEIFDSRAISENGEKRYYTRYIIRHFYVCKYWGKVMITGGYEGDPDGA
ncbi:MAG: hypothetical protein LBL57_10710, partial [Tannerella sp.]|nr:hypothetical protein [Tannerella sp.]